jgi:glycosyltransferase involved in cell wall biosynthesis
MTKGGFLGLAMIVKNDAERIKAALQSCKNICAQMVVVDTGSKDTTVHSAREYGAEVFKFEWNDSFSDARNFALSKMRTPWVLILDSDEVVENIDLKLIKQADDTVGGFTVNIVNNLVDNSDEHYSMHRYTRIIRNKTAFKFTGRVHEQIRDSIEIAGLRIIGSDMSIRHYGYQNIDKTKLHRNLRLLKLDEQERPHDDFIKYHIAQTYFGLENIYEARERFYQLIDSPMLTQDQRDFSKVRIAQTLLAEDKFNAIIAMCDYECSNVELEGLRKYILGTVYLSLKQYAKAFQYYDAEEVFISGMTNKELLQEVLLKIRRFSGK